MKVQIQLRDEIIPGTQFKRTFVDRVVAQEFGDGIYTLDNINSNEIWLFHKKYEWLGFNAKTERGLKSAITKMRKAVQELDNGCVCS